MGAGGGPACLKLWRPCFAGALASAGEGEGANLPLAIVAARRRGGWDD